MRFRLFKPSLAIAVLLFLTSIYPSGALALSLKPTSPIFTVLSNGLRVSDGDVTSHDVTVSIGGSKSPDGIRQYRYYVNKSGTDGSWKVYSGPFTIRDEGSYTIFAVAVGNSGMQDRATSFVNFSFMLIRSTLSLNSTGTAGSVRLNWTTPPVPQPYTYRIYRDGGSDDYIEGNNLVPASDGQFTGGQLSDHWNKGYTGWNSGFEVLKDGSRNYLRVHGNDIQDREACATLMVSGLSINTRYRLEFDYRYPVDSLSGRRNFGLVSQSDMIDVYNIGVPGGFSETSDWKHFTYDFNSKNNTALRFRTYAVPATVSDVSNIAVRPLQPKVLNATTGNNYLDRTASDEAAPNPVTSFGLSSGQITYTPPVDRGTRFGYHVSARGSADSLDRVSNSAEAAVTSGFKGVYYYINDNPSNTNFDSTGSQVLYTTKSAISYNAQPVRQYLHIKAADYAGNISYPAVYAIPDTVPPSLSVSGNPSEVVHKPPTLSFTATDPGSGVLQIETPDGVWHAGASVSYTVDRNGTYTVHAKDKAGNISSRSVTVSKIGDLLYVGDVSDAAGAISPLQPVAANVHLKADFEAVAFSNLSFKVQDHRWQSKGWRLFVQMDPLVSGTHCLPAGSIQLGTPSLSGSVSTVRSHTGYAPIDANQNVLLADSTAGGVLTVDLSHVSALKVDVPASAYAGTYRSTLNWILVTAP